MVQRDDANLYLRIGVNVSSDTSIKQCAIGHKPLQAQSSYLCIFIIGLYFAFLCFWIFVFLYAWYEDIMFLYAGSFKTHIYAYLKVYRCSHVWAIALPHLHNGDKKRRQESL